MDLDFPPESSETVLTFLPFTLGDSPVFPGSRLPISGVHECSQTWFWFGSGMRESLPCPIFLTPNFNRSVKVWAWYEGLSSIPHLPYPRKVLEMLLQIDIFTKNLVEKDGEIRKCCHPILSPLVTLRISPSFSTKFLVKISIYSNRLKLLNQFESFGPRPGLCQGSRSWSGSGIQVTPGLFSHL